MKIKIKRSRMRQKIHILGRPLLVVDNVTLNVRFMPRNLVPPSVPVHFPAMEPFTILGINPNGSDIDTIESSKTRATKWLASFPDSIEFDREKDSIANAIKILGDRRSCIQYKSFASVYDKSIKRLTRSKIQRTFARAIVGCAPGLRKRQTIRNIQAGGILGISFLVSLVLLVVVITIPVGGVSILGITLLANTLIAAWGPFAVIPVAALMALGGFGAFWYKRHKDVFLELQGYLGQVMDYIEAIAYAIEDIFLLDGFRLFQDSSSTYRINKEKIQKARDNFVSEFVDRYVSKFVTHLSAEITENESAEGMSPEKFFLFLSGHPGELQQCFQKAFLDLVIEMRSDLLQLEAETTARREI